MNNDLRRLPFLVKLSRSTRSVINQNFLFGVVFIIGGMTLAALGKVPPVLAAAMHTGGSLIVVFNSARLVRKGEELEHYHPAPVPSGPERPAPPAPAPALAAKPA
jgi:Cd2+/Zn2+-exporting ATPase